jgi:hypothetical protein
MEFPSYFKAFLDKHLPKDKETCSRDYVELLLKLAWEEACRAQKVEADIKKRGPRGPYEID